VTRQLDTKTAFALVLETAAEQFRVLQSLVRGDVKVIPRQTAACSIEQFRAESCIQMALAKEFVFNARRALRISQQGAAQLRLDRLQRKSFENALASIVDTRDVNEHGFDPAGNTNSRPTLHRHELDDAILDETSLIICNPDKILMGPLNLATVYEAVERMRLVAGFASLKRGPDAPSQT